MKPITKKIFIVSGVLAAAGVILLGAGRMMGGHAGFIITRNGIYSSDSVPESYVQKKIPVDSFTNIDISMQSWNDVSILPSDDGTYYLEYSLSGNLSKPVWEVSDDTFFFSSERIFSDGVMNFGFGFSEEPDTQERLTLYVPESAMLGTVSIDSNASVTLTGFTAETLSLVLDYDDADLTELTADQIRIQSDDGDITAKQLIADSLIIENNYGDVELTDLSCDATTITLDSGDLTLDALEPGSLLCKTEYGNVELSLPAPLTQYAFDIQSEYGDVRLPDEYMAGLYEDSDDITHYTGDGDGEHTIRITADSSDIHIQERSE